MAMSMRRAFSARFVSMAIWVESTPGTYDDDNFFTAGADDRHPIQLVNNVGNKFSQFTEGESWYNHDGGRRKPNYRQIYIKAGRDVEDLIRIGGGWVEWRGDKYNVLELGDESIFGFRHAILEKSEGDPT